MENLRTGEGGDSPKIRCAQSKWQNWEQNPGHLTFNFQSNCTSPVVLFSLYDDINTTVSYMHIIPCPRERRAQAYLFVSLHDKGCYQQDLISSMGGNAWIGGRLLDNLCTLISGSFASYPLTLSMLNTWSSWYFTSITMPDHWSWQSYSDFAGNLRVNKEA